MTLRAHEITQEDVDGLRAQGLSDTDIVDIALASAERSFFSNYMEAVGVRVSPQGLEGFERLLGKELVQTLSVGRPLVVES